MTLFRPRASTAALLVLALPVASSLDFYLGWPLRRIAAEATCRLLALGGIGARAEGAMLVIGDQVLSVDPACSGIRMLRAALVLGAALGALHALPAGRIVALLLGAAALAVAGNVIRATALVHLACVLMRAKAGDLPLIADLAADPARAARLHAGVGLVVFAAGSPRSRRSLGIWLDRHDGRRPAAGLRPAGHRVVPAARAARHRGTRRTQRPGRLRA